MVKRPFINTKSPSIAYSLNIPRDVRVSNLIGALADENNLKSKLAVSHSTGPIVVRKLSIRGTQTSPTNFRMPVFALSQIAAIILSPISNDYHSDQLDEGGPTP